MANVAYKKEAIVSVGGFKDLHVFENSAVIKAFKRRGYKTTRFDIAKYHLVDARRYTLGEHVKHRLLCGYWAYIAHHNFNTFWFTAGYPIRLLAALILIALSFKVEILWPFTLIALSIGYLRFVQPKVHRIKLVLATFPSYTHKLAALFLVLIIIFLEIIITDVGKFLAMIDGLFGKKRLLE